MHCAGDVSFDPAIDEAFQTNVLGTQALMEKMLAATEGRCHYVHVSTAYVSGRRRGAILEAPVQHDVDWRIETRWGMGMREHIEETSRTPGQLGAFLKPAERDHGRAGPLSVSEDAEAAAQGLGQEAPGRRRWRARAHARLDRLLHLHQGPR